MNGREKCAGGSGKFEFCRPATDALIRSVAEYLAFAVRKKITATDDQVAVIR